MSTVRNTPRGRMVGGKYELIRVAGEGGMATVWLAQMHGAMGFSRTVALKKMKASLRAQENNIAMFVEEARVGSELIHPNIAQVLDFVEDADGMFCLITEWVEGIDLSGFLRAQRDRGQRLAWPLVTAIGVGALRGLAAAHERSTVAGELMPVIHRDVSPHNILLGVNGIVKLSDFGLARALDRMQSLTAPGLVKGKLSYIAPEVARGAQANQMTDQFSMGSVLWEMLSGRALFDGTRDIEVFRKVHRGEVTPLAAEREGLPPRLVDAVHRCLALVPEDRFPSARAAAQELASILAGALSDGRRDAQTQLGLAVLQIRQPATAPTA